jgi:azobenzene reductase
MNKTILIINFSLRKNGVAQSHKVAHYLQNQIGESAEVLDYVDLNLPMWDEGVYQKDQKWNDILTPIKAKLAAAHSLIYVIPEYSGSASPALANWNLFFTGGEIAHIPALLVSVSNGRSGSYPIAQARSFAVKNTKVCYLPEHIIIRECETVLNDADATEKSDIYIRARIDFALKILQVYSQNFVSIRSQVVVDTRFINGM